MNPLRRIAGLPALLAFALACQLDQLIDTPGPPGGVRLVFRQPPTTTTAGVAITPPVEVVAVNAGGNRLTDFTGTVHIDIADPPDGATLSGSRDASAVDGVATFPGVSIPLAGTQYRLAATADSAAAVMSSTFAINPGPPERLTFTVPPSTTRQNEPITPAVRVTAVDRYANVATGFTGTVVMAIGHNASALRNASLTGETERAAAAGVATFPNLRIDRPGIGYTLVATESSLPPTESDSFDVTLVGSGATRLEIAQQPSDVQVNEAIAPPVIVRAVDDLGVLASGFVGTVTLSIADNPGGATLSGGSAPTVGGVATFSALKLNQSGTGYTLEAMTSELAPVTTASFDVRPPPPPTGSLTVTASTSGGTPDPDGYTVTLNGGESRSIGVGGSTTYQDLAPASYTVQLGGIATNCTLTNGPASRAVTVAAGQTAAVTFSVNCPTPVPTTGALTVTASTSGGTPDPDGYTVTVNGGQSRTIGVAGSTTYEDLAPASYTVQLGGLAANCTLTNGPASRAVTVVAGQTASVTFSVDCPTPVPTTGDLTVTASTSGGTPDPNGYVVTLNGGQSRNIGVAESTIYEDLAPASYTVQLGGIAGNCTLTNGPASRAVTVVAGQTASVTFSVDCPTPAPTATQLRFSDEPPAVILLFAPFSVEVMAQDDQGRVATNYTGPVTLTLQGLVLLGGLTGDTNVNAVNGIARFSGLRVTGTCLTGCSLSATAPGLSGTTSRTFTVIAGQ